MVFVDYEKEISRVVVVLLSLVCVCGKPAEQPNWTCTEVLVVSHVLCVLRLLQLQLRQLLGSVSLSVKWEQFNLFFAFRETQRGFLSVSVEL